MPKIVSPGATNAVRFQDGANHWRFVGIEIASASTYHPNGYTPGVYFGYALVDKYCYPNYGNCTTTPQTIPDSIFFDRCYVHGDATHDLQEGLTANFSNFALVDSYVSDIHGKGLDSQAVAAYETPGPIKLVNNHLEGAGENVILGGSGGGWGGFVPSDIEVRNNYFYKPLAWVPLSLNGTYVVKNAFECKSCRRLLFDSNTIENVWAAGQVGAAFLLTVRTSQSGDIAVIYDVTVTNNVLKNVVMGFSTLAADSLCGPPSSPNCHVAGDGGRWVFKNNVVTLWDSTKPGAGAHSGGIQLSPGRDTNNNMAFMWTHDVLFQHNSVVPVPGQSCWGAVWFVVGAGYNPPKTVPFSNISNNVWILDNVLCGQPTGDVGQVGISGLKEYMGSPGTPDVTARFYGNVMYAATGVKVQTWPSHNYASTVPFNYVNPSIIDYQLATPYWTDTSNGQIAGVSFAKLPTSTGSNVALYPSSR